MIIKPHSYLVFLMLACLGLSACGGSSNSASTAPVVKAIIVNAGNDITINENESIALVGGSSGGQGAITYLWQTDSAIQITHADTSTTSASLLAPMVSQVTTYSLSLLATDTVGAQQSDTIVITVNPVNEAPIAVIQANQISGYPVNQFPVTSKIILNGATSSDTDPQTSDAAITQYEWQQIAGPSLLAGINSTQSIVTFASPIIDEEQQAIIRLTVTDQEQTTGSTDYSFTLLSQGQTQVEVVAKSPRSVFSGEMIVLSATASSLAPQASPFTALWSNNSTAQIIDPTAFMTVATSPLVTQNQSFSYSVLATDSFRNAMSVDIAAQVYAPVARVLNDTGAIYFATGNSIGSQHQFDYPGQDAYYGADRQTASGQVIKVGGGEQGFDFTRLDNNGDAIESPNIKFSCVRDNITALVWQIKEQQDPASINYAHQKFTWYAEEDNGNFAGELNSDSDSCNITSQACNTMAYIDQVNSVGLCGFYDWRLPTPNELQSIIHYGKTNPPMVDTEYFPNLENLGEPTQWYWSGQTSADGVNEEVAYNAWAYDLQTGNDGFLNKTTEQGVILVRAGR